MIVCPPKKIAGVPNKEWTDLVDAFDEKQAHLAFIRNGYELPDVQTAQGLLDGSIPPKTPGKTIPTSLAGQNYFKVADAKTEEGRQRNIHNTYYEELKNNRHSQFKEVTTIENVYNRCIIYDAHAWHRANNYFGKTKDDSRLSLVFFGKFDNG